uniref:Cytochrome c oxidase copper chaperone n=2 Tax=Vitis vinifera TaxID=29760 RepID=F6H247_VITVI
MLVGIEPCKLLLDNTNSPRNVKFPIGVQGTCDIMGGLPTEQPASALTLAGLQQTRGSEPVSKPKKKICCACPDTKKIRDDCIVEHGEAACEKWIEAHRRCLRAEGFKV